MARLSQRRPFLTFYLLALLLVILVMLVAFLTGATAILPQLFAYLEEENAYPNIASIGGFALSQEPMALLILLFAAAPSLAALIVVSRQQGWQGVKTLLGKLRPFGNSASKARGRRGYVILIVGFALGCGLYYAVGYFMGSPDSIGRVHMLLGGSLISAVPLLIVGVFIDEGGTLEELGWRGFAWPVLAERMGTPLIAAITLGIAWWFWHLPRDIPTILTTPQLGAYVQGQGLFLLLCVVETIVCVYFVNLAGGSVLPAIIIHGGTNVWSKALGAPVYEALGFDLRTAILVAAAAVILAKDGRNLGATRQ